MINRIKRKSSLVNSRDSGKSRVEITQNLCNTNNKSGIEVLLTKQAERDLYKVPLHIAQRFQTWVDLVESEGLREARKIPSFHDEPLKGKRKGQRSIRLNKAYRAIYVEKSQNALELIEVQEVNKHEY